MWWLRICILLALGLSTGVEGAAVDVALNKEILEDALDVTCGVNGAEEYYAASELYKAPGDRKLMECTNTSTHRPSYMVDGRSDTFWQTSYLVYITKSSASATIDLGWIYEVEKVEIKFGDSKRPRRIMLEKSEDGITYKKWVIRVTEIADCTRVFGVQVNFAPKTIDDVVCSTFTNEIVPPSYETVHFDFKDIHGNLGRWRNARFIRMTMSSLYTPLGYNGYRFYHLSITDLVVMSECMCFGHQIGCTNATGRYACECGMNTQGDYCEECLPGFNQQLIQDDEPCEECNCFNHATECVYDFHVAEFNLSLNMNGERIGGGRCIDCQDNTTGVNCELCLVKYFRPASVLQTAQDACRPCDCHLPGCVVNPESGALGDCLMNNDNAPPVIGMLPGDCFCKSNVQSTRCDECKPGFYNLQEGNVDGCQACLCNVAGTVGGSEVCEADEGGQCPCKTNVMGRQCDQCNDQFYGLAADNLAGCTPCDCDPGGAYDNVCNKETGQCRCRPNIEGRTCNAPVAGHYYPGPYYISAEFEKLEEWDKWDRTDTGYYGFGYWLASSQNPATTSLTVPIGVEFSGSYSILLRYRNSGFAQGSLSVQPSAGGEIQTAAVTLALCNSGSDWCIVEILSRKFTLDKGRPYTVAVTLTTGEPKLDAVIALPVEYTTQATLTAVLGATAANDFIRSCDVKNNDLKVGTTLQDECLGGMFSLATRFLDGALSCRCDTFGADLAEGCESYGGQCSCRPGVGGSTRCDQCLLEFYDLTIEGCKACECVSENKVCAFAGGQCVCPPNVEGRRCDVCARNHWAWSGTEGCRACECNVTGSLHLQCNQESGVCACKQGVNSDKCDACLPEYKDFGVTGCQGCDCNEDGSTSFLCDDDSGQCPCKANVQGLKCSECAAGTFYNDASHAEGCLACICMGVTSSCSSTTQRLQQTAVPLTTTDADTGDVVPAWSVVTDDGNVLEVLEISVGSVTNPDTQAQITALQVTLGDDATANWFQSPVFSGNLLSLYHNSIEMDVHYTRTDPSGAATPLAAILVGRSGAAIRFPLEAVAPDTIATLSLSLREDRVGAGETVTRGELMLELTDATLFLPATFSTREHVSSLLAVRYEAPSSTGFLERAWPNEMCSCGIGYTGMSCEACAYGYRREGVAEHEYLGTCVPCECNGHADFCDPDSGECQDCQHSTTGFNCEVCEAGQYGDATAGTTTDCRPCPCYTPRVLNSTCELITEGDLAGLPQCSFCAPGYTGRLCDECDVFHFGNPEVQDTGTCTECSCNGNTETCDSVTGRCLDCQHETTGDHCERCRDEFYGNATTQSCQACGCDMSASETAVCDHETGQCTCFPGVGNRICDRCQENMYGFNDPDIHGCLACECNEHGSETLQCADDTGICTCKAESGGDKCQFCSETRRLWGLPHRPCQDCLCNEIGTVDPSLPCEKVSGQCDCKPGVTGRQCDECQRLYFDFSMTGCIKCGVCQDSLGNDTLKLQEMWWEYWNHTQDIAKLQEQDLILQNLSNEISQTSSELGVSEDRLGVLENFVQNLTDSEPSNTDSVDSLMDSLTTILASSGAQEESAEAQLARVNGMVADVDGAMAAINEMKADVPSAITQLQAHNQSAHELQAAASETYDGSIDVSFLEQLAAVNAEVLLQADTLNDANDMAAMVEAQATTTGDLRTQVLAEQSKLTTIDDDLDGVAVDMSAVRAVEKAVDDIMELTLYDKDYAETRFAEASASLTEADAIMTSSQAEFAEGGRLFQDCVHIIDGSRVPLPIDTEVDLTGGDYGRVTGWTQASDLLRDLLTASTNQRTISLENIAGAEVRAEDLTAAAQLLENEFRRVQPRGQSAVDAIDNYQAVVDTLADSVEQAGIAQATMASVMSILNDVSVEDMSAQADAAQSSSEDAATRADDYDGLPATLRPQLTAANNALDASVATWAALDVTLDNFVTSVGDLETAVANAEFSSNVAAANSAGDSAISRAELLTSQDAELEPQVGALEDLVAIVQSTLDNASVLQTTIAKDVEAFTDDLAQTRSTITSIESEYNATTAKLLSIEAKLAAIEARVAEAEALLVAVEQPVRFREAGDALRVENPLVRSGMEFNEVSLQFKFTSLAEGLLFFVENTESREKILIQLIEGRIQYEYSNVDVDMTVTSKADLFPNVWFSILATRYGISIQLTVTRMDTGGVAVEHYRAESTQNEQLTLNSQIVIGGPPTESISDKIASSLAAFQGCIYSVFLGGDVLPLWQSVLHHESNAQCCARPPDLPAPELVDGVSFDGFGYMTYNPGTFSVGSALHLRLEFRTWTPYGTVLLADQADTNGWLGVFMDNGRAALDFGLNGVRHTLMSDQMYNDGEWYELTVMVNSTFAQIYVKSTNVSVSDVDVRSLSHSLDLAPLAPNMLTFGAQNPRTGLSFGPSSSQIPFSGCLRHFQHNTAPSLILESKSLAGGALETEAVRLDSCFNDVQSGLGIAEVTGYAQLRNLPEFINTLSFEFATSQPSGVLMYAPLASSTTFFSLSLYNGNVMLLLNQGSGVQNALMTSDLYLSNGKLHTVAVDFTFTNRPRLIVDDNSHTPLGAYTMSPRPGLRERSLYLGGVPSSTVTLNPDTHPVRHSLVAGFREIRVNGQVVSYWSPSTLSRSEAADQRSSYLSGIPISPSTPPPPYVTTPPPPTTPAPTCRDPYAFSDAATGTRFGSQTISYLAFPATSLGEDYQQAFSISVVFRALQPTGLLYYMSHPSRADYFALYMSGGAIYARMKRNNDAATAITVRSPEGVAFDDGNWWTLIALRVNDFLALIVQNGSGQKYYQNNNGDTAASSTLEASGNIFLGGYLNPTQVPFSEFGIQPTGFQGCMRSVMFTKHSYQDVYFDVGLGEDFVRTGKVVATPSERVGVAACYVNVEAGLHMTGDTSYVKLDDRYTIDSAFSFDMGFTTTERNVTLMLAYRSSTEFFLLDVIDGKFRVSMGSNVGAPLSVESTQEADDFAVCSGILQTVSVDIQATGVALRVNGYQDAQRQYEIFPFPDGYSKPGLSTMDIYIGGLPSTGWTVPVDTGKDYFHGCVKSVTVKDRSYMLTSSAVKNNVQAGCPLPPVVG